MNKKNTKQSAEAETASKESTPEPLTPQSRFNSVLKPLEDSYLWWHHLAETGKVPTKTPVPIRVQRKLEQTKSKKSPISVLAEEYLGGEPKRYPDYAALENENFPDLFREVFENDISSLYEAIASSKAAALYSNLMTARLQQLEKEKKKKQKLPTNMDPKIYPHTKESLASYMVDIVTKYLLSSKDGAQKTTKKKAVESPKKQVNKESALMPDGSVVVRKKTAKPKIKKSDSKESGSEEKPKRKRKERKTDENK